LKEIQGLARTKLVEYGRMRLPVQPKDFAGQLHIIVQPFCPAQLDVSSNRPQRFRGGKHPRILDVF
jgi:hypothetical protein